MVTPWKMRKLREDTTIVGVDYKAGTWVLFRYLRTSGIYMPWFEYKSFEGALSHWKRRQGTTQTNQ